MGVKQKRWPDWGLNPGPSRHIVKLKMIIDYSQSLSAVTNVI